MNLPDADFARLRAADEALVAVLRAHALDVVVVSSADGGGLASNSGDDIDVIGRPRSLQSLEAAVRDEDGAWRILRSFRYGSAGRRTDLVCMPMERVLWIGLDCAAWLGTKFVRVLDSGALMAMSEIDEASGLRRLNDKGSVAYAVAKAIVKGNMRRNESAYRALSAWRDCGESDREWLRSFFGSEVLEAFLSFVIEDGRADAECVPARRRLVFLARAAARDPWGVAACAWGSIRMLFTRLSRPHGAVVCFTGPDGSGKSSLLRECAPRLSGLFRETVEFHFSPSTLPARTTAEVSDPHSKPPYSAVGSVLKLVYLLVGANLGWVLRVAPRLRIGALVAFDRYFDDVLVDPARYRLALPTQFLELACNMVPKADVRVVLLGDEELVAARKLEVSAEQTGRLMAAYASLSGLGAASVEVRTEDPLSQGADAVIAELLGFMVTREERRVSGWKVPR